MLEIEELQLLSLLFGFSLVSNVDTNHVFIPALAYCCHKISFAPKFSAPKLLFHFGVLLEYFSCRDTLYHLYQFCWSILWGCAHKIVDVICVYPYLFKRDFISLFNFFAYFNECMLAVFVPEYRFTIFHRSYKMIVYLICAVLRFLDRSHTLYYSLFGNRPASWAE